MTIILVLAHISFKFCFWFLLASSLLPKMYNGSFGFYIQRFSLTFIDKSSFFKLYCILFFSSLLISYTIDCEIITSFIEYGFPNINLEQFSDFSIKFSGGISTNSAITDSVNNYSSSALISSKAADAAIMTTGLSLSKTFMKSAPNLHSKAMVVGTSIMIGATAIIAKNFNFDLGSKKNKFIDLESSVAKFYDLTGNSVTDLLKIINHMQYLQLTILCLTLYYFILFNISEDKIEFYLMKILPNIIVSVIIKNVKFFKKTGFILLILLLLLSIIAGYLVFYYLDFFLTNFDDICEYYIENKNKNK
jgi:hypothetical protein